VQIVRRRSTTVVSHPHLQGNHLIRIFFLCLGLRFEPPFVIRIFFFFKFAIWTAAVWAIWTTRTTRNAVVFNNTAASVLAVVDLGSHGSAESGSLWTLFWYVTVFCFQK
jgi:hypothetical protein